MTTPRSKTMLSDRPAVKQHCLVFIPGIMGSELRFQGLGTARAPVTFPVWTEDILQTLRAITNAPECLGSASLVVGPILRALRFAFLRVQLYGPLLDYITTELGYSPGIDFIPFAYDWRQDNAVTAHQLGDLLRTRANGGTDRFRIVAHSMGGLIARWLLADPTYSDIKARTECLLQIATPVRGSAKAYYTLKMEPLLLSSAKRLFDLAGFVYPHFDRRFMDALRGFHSVYQLLPPPGDRVLFTPSGQGFSAFDSDVWAAQYRPLVAKAAITYGAVSAGLGVRQVTAYGCGFATSREFQVDDVFNVTRDVTAALGDGTVTVDSAVAGTPTTCIPFDGRTSGHTSLLRDADLLSLVAAELS